MAFRGIQATNIISTVVGLSDPLLILNKTGEIPTDIGFLGKIGPTTYAGLIKDAETNNFLLISQITLSSQTINDVSAIDASLVKGSLEVATITATAVHPTTTFVLPKGTAAQRPTNPVAAQMFFNTETKLFNAYDYEPTLSNDNFLPSHPIITT